MAEQSKRILKDFLNELVKNHAETVQIFQLKTF